MIIPQTAVLAEARTSSGQLNWWNKMKYEGRVHLLKKVHPVFRFEQRMTGTIF